LLTTEIPQAWPLHDIVLNLLVILVVRAVL
jgi:hypothetical protein